MQRPNLYDYIKVIALTSMIVDHIGYFLYPEEIWLRVLGRVAFPLFLLLVGYNGSYSMKKPLLILGIILQGILWVGWYKGVLLDPVLNILLAIVCTRILLGRITKKSFSLQVMIAVLSVLIAPMSFAYIDYGTYSIAFALVGRRIRTQSKTLSLAMAYVLICVYMLTMIVLFPFPSYTRFFLALIALVFCVLSTCLAKQNSEINIHPVFDTVIVRLGVNALFLYCLHGMILIAMMIVNDL